MCQGEIGPSKENGGSTSIATVFRYANIYSQCSNFPKSSYYSWVVSLIPWWLWLYSTHDLSHCSTATMENFLFKFICSWACSCASQAQAKTREWGTYELWCWWVVTGLMLLAPMTYIIAAARPPLVQFLKCNSPNLHINLQGKIAVDLINNLGIYQVSKALESSFGPFNDTEKTRIWTI